MAAAKHAGFAEARVIAEPVATAIAYLSRGQQGVRHCAVYDLGGGTFDLACLDCSKRPLEILSHGGDLYLGGDEIDRGIADWVAEKVLQQYNWDLTEDQAVRARLVVECEQAKIRLTENEATLVDLRRVDPAAPAASHRVELSRQIVTDLASDLVRRTFTLCDEVIRNAGLSPSKIDALFVAGGTTLLPTVRDGLQAYFGKPVGYAFHPMYTVAIGASIATGFA